jgi:GNAT superfamily N-acetyltransferase
LKAPRGQPNINCAVQYARSLRPAAAITEGAMQPTPQDERGRQADEPAPLYRKLRRAEHDGFEAHLLRLDAADRRMRFCIGATDQAIRDYCARKDWWKTTTLGCFIDGTLRGAAELVRIEGADTGKAELAVTVEKPFQDRGIGTALLGKSLTLARNRYIGTVVMICLAENRRMRHIAHKFGAELDFSGGEIEGRLWPPWPTIASFMEEAAMEGEAIFRLSFETATRR